MLLLSTISFNWYWLHRIFEFAKKAKYDWIELVLTKNNYDALVVFYSIGKRSNNSRWTDQL